MDSSALILRSWAGGLGTVALIGLVVIGSPGRNEDREPPDSLWPLVSSRPASREESRFLQCLTRVMHEHGVTLAPEDRAHALAAFRDAHAKNFEGLQPIVDLRNPRGQAMADAIERRFIAKYGCVLH